MVEDFDDVCTLIVAYSSKLFDQARCSILEQVNHAILSVELPGKSVASR